MTSSNIESLPSLNLISEESPSVELLGIFFVLFAIVATVLLPVAWYTRSCHLVVPHLIMQVSWYNKIIYTYYICGRAFADCTKVKKVKNMASPQMS